MIGVMRDLNSLIDLICFTPLMISLGRISTGTMSIVSTSRRLLVLQAHCIGILGTRHMELCGDQTTRGTSLP